MSVLCFVDYGESRLASIHARYLIFCAYSLDTAKMQLPTLTAKGKIPGIPVLWVHHEDKLQEALTTMRNGNPDAEDLTGVPLTPP